MPIPSRAFDQVNVRDTIQRLNGCVERRQVRQQEIASATEIEKTKLSRWLNEKSNWSSIGDENYGRILDFISEKNLFAQ